MLLPIYMYGGTKVSTLFQALLQHIKRGKMQTNEVIALLKLVLWASLALALLPIGYSMYCEGKGPSLKQTQVGGGLGSGRPPRFTVVIQNKCERCPVIDVHVKCGNFSQALVNPRLFRVLGNDDCVINNAAPLRPLEKMSFSYSHTKYHLHPSIWFFQCE